jgi:hypothetical protein
LIEQEFDFVFHRDHPVVFQVQLHRGIVIPIYNVKSITKLKRKESYMKRHQREY